MAKCDSTDIFIAIFEVWLIQMILVVLLSNLM